jgi:biopolymer transport protein ExbD
LAVTLKESEADDLPELSDINVTPFIDVMLVLLIIFMVAAPLSTVDVAVDLPVSNAEAQPRPDKPVFLTLGSDLALALGDDPVGPGALQRALDERTDGDRERRIYLRADRSVAYGELMKVMNLLREVGYLKIALVGLEDAGQPGAASTPASPPARAAQP